MAANGKWRTRIRLGILLLAIVFRVVKGYEEMYTISQLSPRSAINDKIPLDLVLQTSEPSIAFSIESSVKHDPFRHSDDETGKENIDEDKHVIVARSATPIDRESRSINIDEIPITNNNEIDNELELHNKRKYYEIHPTKTVNYNIHTDEDIVMSEGFGDKFEFKFPGEGNRVPKARALASSGPRIRPTAVQPIFATATLKEQGRQNSDIQNIITGIVKLLNGNVNVQANSQLLNGRPGRPMASRINNRGPPRISDVPPLPDFDKPVTPPAHAYHPTKTPPPYPFDRPPHHGVNLPEQIVPPLNPHRPGIYRPMPPWQRPRPRPPNRRPNPGLPMYKPTLPPLPDLPELGDLPDLEESKPEEEITVSENETSHSENNIHEDNKETTSLNPEVNSTAIEEHVSETTTTSTTTSTTTQSTSTTTTTTQKPTERTTTKPIQKTTPKLVEKTTQKPMEKTTQKPIEKTTQKPIEKTTEKIKDKTTKKPIETTTLKHEETTKKPQTTTEKPSTTTEKVKPEKPSKPEKDKKKESSINNEKDKNKDKYKVSDEKAQNKTRNETSITETIQPSIVEFKDTPALSIATPTPTDGLITHVPTIEEQLNIDILKSSINSEPLPTSQGIPYHPYRPRPGIVLDDTDFKPHGSRYRPEASVITAPETRLPGYGEIFDVTVSAIQGPGEKGASVHIENVNPISGHADHDDIIVSPAGDQGFVSIDGKRTYLNLFDSSTPVGTAPSIRPTHVQNLPHSGPTNAPPPLGPGIGTGIAIPTDDVPQPPIRRPQHGRPPQTYRRPQPTVRIDTCIVGDDSTCDQAQNEKCRTEAGISSCQCRPGYARRVQRDPCRRVVALLLALRVDRLYDRQVVWDAKLADKDSEPYQQLSYEAIRAIDSAFSMTPFSDDFVSGSVNSVHKDQGTQAVFVNYTVLLQETAETLRPTIAGDIQKHILGVIRRRSNNVGASALWVDTPAGSVLPLKDLDECSSSEFNDCHHLATCTNTWGGFRCTCPGDTRDPAAGSVGSAGRACAGCPAAHCSDRGVCSYRNDQPYCTIASLVILLTVLGGVFGCALRGGRGSSGRGRGRECRRRTCHRAYPRRAAALES